MANSALDVLMQKLASENTQKQEVSPDSVLDEVLTKVGAAPVSMPPGAGLGRMMGMGIGRASGNYGAALIQALQNMASTTNDDVLKAKINDLLNYLNSNDKQASAPEGGDLMIDELFDVYSPAIVKTAGVVADFASAALYDIINMHKVAADGMDELLMDEDMLGNLGIYLDSTAKVASDPETVNDYSTVAAMFKIASADPLIDYMVRTMVVSDYIPEESQEAYWGEVTKEAGDIPVTLDTLAVAEALAELVM